MSDSSSVFRECLLGLLAEAVETAEGAEATMRRLVAGAPVPADRRRELAALPYEADRARVRLWLQERLETGACASEPELRLRVVHTRWRGRLEGCDLELDGDGDPAGSAVLAGTMRAALRRGHGARDDDRTELDPLLAVQVPMAWGALLLDALLPELDPRLVLAGHRVRAVSIVCEGADPIELGEIGTEGW